MFQNDSANAPQQRSPSRSRTIATSIFGSSRSSSPSIASTEKKSVPEVRHVRHLRPAPLVELTLQSTAKSNALTKAIATELRSLLPQRLQLRDTWQCIYNLDQHGVSLATLYSKCYEYRDKLNERPGFVLVVKDSNGSIFGASVNEYFRPSASYYGNGECFLYKTQILQQEQGSGGGGMRFKAFPWTGLNDYQIYCTSEFISIGGGDGKYGLWLDDRLEKGLSSSTLTFGNEALSNDAGDGRLFSVHTVEVWKI